MKKARWMAVAGLCVLTAVLTAQGWAAEDAKAVMQKSLDAMKVSNLESVATLIIKDDKGNERVRKFTSATKEFPADGVKKTIMRFLEPADVKGTGFLTFEYSAGNKDNDMWLYMPALRKTRRIVSSEKTKSFMGSEFSNSDITAPKVDEYQYKFLADEKIDGLDCWQIECLPATPDVAEQYGYSKKITWISKHDDLSRKTEFYDIEGKLVKVLTTRKAKLLDKGRNLYQATDILMENVQNGRKSQFLISQSALNNNLKAELFTTEYLAR